MKNLIIVITFFTSYLTYAQGGRVLEKIEAQRIAYITNYLRLTPDESKTFWPIYGQYIENMKQTKRDAIPTKPVEDMTDQEAEKAIASVFEKENKLLELKKDCYQKLRKVLSSRKIAMLYKAELEFKSELLNAIKEKRQERKRMRE
jgi:hypothetical protein